MQRSHYSVQRKQLGQKTGRSSVW